MVETDCSPDVHATRMHFPAIPRRSITRITSCGTMEEVITAIDIWGKIVREEVYTKTPAEAGALVTS